MNKKVRIILIVLLVLVFVGAGIKLISVMKEYSEAESLYQESRNAFVIKDESPEASKPSSEDEDVPQEPEEYFPNVETDFDTLQETNPDVFGWIWIPSTEISYPLLVGESNQEYLHTGYNLQYTNSGSIFMDYRNNADLTDDNTVIFGHNMNNGSMFGSLKKFREQDFFDEHEFIYIFTPDRAYKYRIFAGYETLSTSDSYTLWFEREVMVDETETRITMSNKEYLEMVAKASLVTSEAEPEEGERLLMLSTCTGNGNYRFVIHAVLIAEKDLSAG